MLSKRLIAYGEGCTRGRRTDPYHFYEQEWESHEELRDEFEWEIPGRMNVPQYVCDRHATDADAVAMAYEDSRGRDGQYTCSEMKTATDRLANFLADVGIERGDRPVPRSSGWRSIATRPVRQPACVW